MNKYIKLNVYHNKEILNYKISEIGLLILNLDFPS